jgi:hypothetical protein
MNCRWMRMMGVSLVVTALAAVLAPQRAAALGACDWLRPDRDMRQLFPQADDYHPIYKRSFDQRDQIEARLGYALAGWENLLRYYQIMKDGRRIGTIYVHLTPDNTQIVVGITNAGAVKGVVLQRYYGNHRELVDGSQFLGQFIGMTLSASFQVGKDVKPAGPGLEQTSDAIAQTIRKLLVFYSVYR